LKKKKIQRSQDGKYREDRLQKEKSRWRRKKKKREMRERERRALYKKEKKRDEGGLVGMV
jgi:hypothetical protein